MDTKKWMLLAVSAIVFFAIATATANALPNTPLYTYRMEQVSSEMGFLPTEKNDFCYTAENGYTVTYLWEWYAAVSHITTSQPCELCRKLKTDWIRTCPKTCETCPGDIRCKKTSWDTCAATCPITCVATCLGKPTCFYYTCEKTCPDNRTCQHTCPETCIYTLCWERCEDTYQVFTCITCLTCPGIATCDVTCFTCPSTASRSSRCFSPQKPITRCSSLSTQPQRPYPTVSKSDLPTRASLASSKEVSGG